MKFAYLIMAHDNMEQLLSLIKLLDWPENDIYLHIDKKSEALNPNDFQLCTQKAVIYIYRKYKVYWGDLSQIRCQFFLLSEASKTYHDYYHLLSGHDLPIKRHKDIIDFFNNNMGKEFVHFESKFPCQKDNCIKYHFLQGIINRMNDSLLKKFLIKTENYSLCLQKKLHIQRKLYCGANWFSITHNLALELLSVQEQLIKKVKFTISGDECVLQTYLAQNLDSDRFYNTNDNDYRAIMRAVDWTRGNPYVWRSSDYEFLLSSPYLYARKFDIRIDPFIIALIVKFVSE